MQAAANEFWYFSEDTVIVTNLNQKEKEDLFYQMILNPEDDNDGWMDLFNWLLQYGVEINTSFEGLTPLEHALKARDEFTAKLLIDHGARIPETITMPAYCDDIPVSSLTPAIETKDPLLIKKLLDAGVVPDSLSYEEWFYIDQPFQYLLFASHQDTSVNLEKGNIIHYIQDKKWAKRLNIKPFEIFFNNLDKLLAKGANQDFEGSGDLANEIFDFAERYYFNNSLFSNRPYWLTKKIRGISLFAIHDGNTALLESFFSSDLRGEIFRVINSQSFIHPDVLDWMDNKGILDSIYQQNQKYTNPYIQKAFIDKGLKLKEINIDTRMFLFDALERDDLKLFYQHKQVSSPEIFSLFLDGDKDAVMAYLERKNPFVTDGYGLSLFELMLYSGMEDAVIKVIEKNKFLPLKKESFALALLGNNKKILDALLQKTTIQDNSSFLYRKAIAAQNTEAVDWLLKHDFDPAECLDNKMVFFTFNKLFRNPEMLQKLLNAGLKINFYTEPYALNMEDVPDFENQSLLIPAIAGRYKKAVRLIVEEQKKRNESIGFEAIYYAAMMGNVDAVELLIENGASPNQRPDAGVSALEFAVIQGETNVVEKMIGLGADYNQPVSEQAIDYIGLNYDGYYLTDIAGNLTTLEYLLSLDIPYSPMLDIELLYAAQRRDNDKVKRYLKKYKHLEANEIFYDATSLNNVELAIWLLDNYSIDIDYALSSAIHSSKLWLFEYCFKNENYRDYLINYRDYEGNSLLHLAASRSHPKLVELLIQNGVDSGTKNHNGFTPYFIAKEFSSNTEWKKVVEVLEAEGASTDYTEKMLNEVFRQALENKRYKKVHECLQKGADPNQQFESSLGRGYFARQTDTIPALYIALQKGDEAICELLLLYGADPNKIYKNDEYGTLSPLSFAMDKNLHKTSRMLTYKGADLHFVPQFKDRASCDLEVPLIERLKKSHKREVVSVLEAAGLDVVKYSENELFDALKNNDTEELKIIMDYFRENYYAYSKSKFDSILYINSSLDMFKYYIEELDRQRQDHKEYHLKRAIEFGRTGFVDYLTDFYEKDWFTGRYNRNPLVSAIAKGSRPFSLLKINKSLNPEKNDFMSDEQRQDYMEIIDILLEKTDLYQDTVCITAAIKGKFYEAFELFLNRGSYDRNMKDAYLSIVRNDQKKLQVLLDNGLSPDTRFFGFSLLACAAWAENTEIFEKLLQAGAEVQRYDRDDYSKIWNRPEIWAVLAGNEVVLSHLHEREAYFDQLLLRNVYGGLQSAYDVLLVRDNKRDALKWLLDQEIIHLAVGSNAENLLSKAIERDDPELMNLLLKYPPDDRFLEETRDYHFYAPLNSKEAIVYALENNAEECFFELINSYKPDISIYEGIKFSQIESVKMMQKILDDGVKVTKSHQFINIVMLAIEKNSPEFLEYYITKSDSAFVARVLENKDYANKPGSATAESGNVEILKILASNGLELEEEMLITAIEKGNKDMVKHLLANNVPWVGKPEYNALYFPDLSNDYEMWKFTTEAIIELEEL